MFNVIHDYLCVSQGFSVRTFCISALTDKVIWALMQGSSFGFFSTTGGGLTGSSLAWGCTKGKCAVMSKEMGLEKYLGS